MRRLRAVTWDNIKMAFLIYLFWGFYILFDGWRKYFFPKVTVISNDKELMSFQKTIHNRYALRCLHEVIMQTECEYPITYKKGMHWLYQVDIVTVENSKCRAQLGLYNEVTVTSL